ncbi:RNA polymerase sigma factor [Polaribacter porphyrae]|uniref:RNA polymerase n=1 Tax=Polaribacter porphyrae TaxID=1137780 RepID=A0A2S7WKD8_9FLAO|nr:sigma-70 family RNA polymerase sigma factor [Polaribacter porphyrae]PQJ78087.1 hypothetical protein BTO18_02265 [Polaribacter porphyrae]
MDEIYIKRVLNGDIDAYGFLVKKYQKIVFHCALSILKNEADAKDAVQDSFVKAFEVLDSFKGDSKFSTWVCKIAINNSLKLAKKKVKAIHLLSDFSKNEDIELNTGIEKIDKNELNILLEKGLNLLSQKEAICIRLYYLEESSISEIEEVTSFSSSNIKVLLHRGRKNLYHYLHSSYEKNFKI